MIKLNCDLGEGYGQYSLGDDSKAMARIDMANIACGFHASDPNIMAATLALAKTHEIMVGAHPSYPDRQGFGRRSMQLSSRELTNLLHYQIATLEGMARVQELTISYVKPHGALYNDMMANRELLDVVLRAIASYPSELKLMLLSQADNRQNNALAHKHKVALIYEVFADRRYNRDGSLVSRSEPGAVLTNKQLIQQVKNLKSHGTVTTLQGTQLNLRCDSLCVHGDNPSALQQIDEIKQILLG